MSAPNDAGADEGPPELPVEPLHKRGRSSSLGQQLLKERDEIKAADTAKVAPPSLPSLPPALPPKSLNVAPKDGSRSPHRSPAASPAASPTPPRKGPKRLERKTGDGTLAAELEVAKKQNAEMLADFSCWGGLVDPDHLYETMSFVFNNALEVEGVFRVSASQLRVQELKDARNEGRLAEEFLVSKVGGDMEILAVVDFMCKFFQDLPEPLMPVYIYHEVLDTVDVKGDLDEDRIQMLRSLLYNLPDKDMYNFCALLHIAYQATTFGEITKMHASNLAICLGPNIMYDPMPILDVLAVRKEAGLMTNALQQYIKDYPNIHEDVFSGDFKEKKIPMMEKLKARKAAAQMAALQEQASMPGMLEELGIKPNKKGQKKTSKQLTSFFSKTVTKLKTKEGKPTEPKSLSISSPTGSAVLDENETDSAPGSATGSAVSSPATSPNTGRHRKRSKAEMLLGMETGDELYAEPKRETSKKSKKEKKKNKFEISAPSAKSLTEAAGAADAASPPESIPKKESSKKRKNKFEISAPSAVSVPDIPGSVDVEPVPEAAIPKKERSRKSPITSPRASPVTSPKMSKKKGRKGSSRPMSPISSPIGSPLTSPRRNVGRVESFRDLRTRGAVAAPSAEQILKHQMLQAVSMQLITYDVMEICSLTFFSVKDMLLDARFDEEAINEHEKFLRNAILTLVTEMHTLEV